MHLCKHGFSVYLFYPIALQQFDHPVNYVTADDPFVLDCTVVGGLNLAIQAKLITDELSLTTV